MVCRPERIEAKHRSSVRSMERSITCRHRARPLLGVVGCGIMSMRDSSTDAWFDGSRLYGDDFVGAELEQWLKDEREAYAALLTTTGQQGTYTYVYHAINTIHGFCRLPNQTFEDVLGFGGAYAEEFLPIIDRIGRITIVDPSDAFSRRELHGVPLTYVKPNRGGALPFDNDSLDLITCLDVLHHVPNVSMTVRELHRCLRPGAFALMREPTVSMGDWTRPRPGLTSRERGIPYPILRRIVADCSFEVVSARRCMFPVTTHLGRIFRRAPYNSRIAVHIDRWLCALFSWNRTYHATHPLQKLRPTEAFLVLRK
jgi:SAM-dependent methyltransferase